MPCLLSLIQVTGVYLSYSYLFTLVGLRCWMSILPFYWSLSPSYYLASLLFTSLPQVICIYPLFSIILVRYDSSVLNDYISPHSSSLFLSLILYFTMSDLSPISYLYNADRPIETYSIGGDADY